MVRRGIVEELVSRRKLTNQCYLLAQARPMTLKHLLVKEFYVSRRKVTQTAKVKEPGNEFCACIQRRGLIARLCPANLCVGFEAVELKAALS